jgi:outer membrane lipase/esterase
MKNIKASTFPRLVPSALKALTAVTALSALGLTGCGGSSTNSTVNPANITSVRVFGDSLADSGTFGFKATVNAAGDDGASTPIWPELIATQLQLSKVCNFYLLNASKPTSNNTCQSYAVSGAVINGFAGTPQSLAYQMDTALTVNQGKLPANELILLDGGGNDAAALLGAYLGAGSSVAGQTNYLNLLTTLLPPAQVGALLSQPTGAQQVGGIYMTALANKLADDITVKLLANGSEKVAVLTIPAITSTPRFQVVLKNIAATSAGIAGAKGVETLTRTWIQTFNQTLIKRFADDKRVAIVDLFSELDAQLSNPAQYGLSNPINPVTGVTDTACPMTGFDSSGLPAYDFVTCTAAALDKTSKMATWRTQSFSDGFHPTPYAHRLAAQFVQRVLTAHAWM